LPILQNIALGGIEDGFAIGTKLTNCVPTPLPILQNIALGGIEDGFAIGTKLTNCVPTPLPILLNIALGGIEDGFAIGKGTCIYVLPIQLVAFSATCEGRTTQLNWRTASEVNNNYFTIEHSTDALTWIALATMAGAGTTSQPHNYTYTTNNLTTVYYRLKQTDYDGAYTYSHILPHTPCANIDSRAISIIPNPNNGSFIISTTNVGNYSIINELGQAVRSFTITASLTTASVSGLANGVYLLQNEANLLHKKIVITE
ncbi:MAG: T9SS type A sorting domain-containing protein, partial [Bacteroidia bacterium]